MSAKSFATIAALIFLIVAVAQLYRAYTGMPVNIGSMTVPVAASWVAGGVAALLSFLGFMSKG